jgi:hypothetical protein
MTLTVTVWPVLEVRKLMMMMMMMTLLGHANEMMMLMERRLLAFLLQSPAIATSHLDLLSSRAAQRKHTCAHVTANYNLAGFTQANPTA